MRGGGEGRGADVRRGLWVVGLIYKTRAGGACLPRGYPSVSIASPHAHRVRWEAVWWSQTGHTDASCSACQLLCSRQHIKLQT